MKPHRTVVERGDTCLLELDIRMIQSEGWFEYKPNTGDVIDMYIKNKDNEIVTQVTKTVEAGNEDNIVLPVPTTTLSKGEYTYDVIITFPGGEKHTICDEYILKIKEDEAYA